MLILLLYFLIWANNKRQCRPNLQFLVWVVIWTPYLVWPWCVLGLIWVQLIVVLVESLSHMYPSMSYIRSLGLCKFHVFGGQLSNHLEGLYNRRKCICNVFSLDLTAQSKASCPDPRSKSCDNGVSGVVVYILWWICLVWRFLYMMFS